MVDYDNRGKLAERKAELLCGIVSWMCLRI